MNAPDQAVFGQLITDAMSFYRRDVSKFALSVWWQACKAFDLEQVSKAVTAHAMDPERGQFPPMPADIVRVLQGTHTDRALIAWGKALDAMRTVGAYQSVVFDDGAIHAVIDDMGGWPKICRSTMDELPHVQRRFTETYRAYSRRTDLPYPPKLLGESEQENNKYGYRAAPPLLIGNPEKARQVMQLGSSVGRVAVTPLQALERSGYKQLEASHDEG